MNSRSAAGTLSASIHPKTCGSVILVDCSTPRGTLGSMPETASRQAVTAANIFLFAVAQSPPKQLWRVDAHANHQLGVFGVPGSSHESAHIHGLPSHLCLRAAEPGLRWSQGGPSK